MKNNTLNTKRFVIRKNLIGKGIKNEFIKDTVNKITDENSAQDFFSAIKICKKKRIGPARTEYKANKSKLDTMPCFIKYKSYTATNNVPTFARDFAVSK